MEKIKAILNNSDMPMQIVFAGKAHPKDKPGQDFIKMFDADGDGKVSHAEWEKLKNETVFKPYRWPQYNRNRDEWITVDEAPKAPAAK